MLPLGSCIENPPDTDVVHDPDKMLIGDMMLFEN
jgi:hypothetical protein